MCILLTDNLSNVYHMKNEYSFVKKTKKQKGNNNGELTDSQGFCALYSHTLLLTYSMKMSVVSYIE